MESRLSAIYQMHAAVAQAEIRIAKELQRFWPNWTWAKCLQEGRTLVARHGINVSIVKE